nr:thioesterase [uncultured bacterium]
MAGNEALARRIESMSPARRALVERRLRGAGSASVGKNSKWSPLVEIQPGNSKNILFGVHPLTGTVTYYLELARNIDEGLTFQGLQAKGLNKGDEPHTSMEAMAAYYIEAIREVQPEGPYMLLGYSLGSHIAYEMAQQLQAAGSRVSLLVFLDTSRSDGNTGFEGEFDDAGYWYLRYHKTLDVQLNELRSLDPDGQVDYIVEHLRRSDDPPSYMNMPHANPHRMLKVEKGNHQAIFTYKHKPYAGPITLLRTAERDASPSDPPDMGWEEYAGGGLKIHRIPGSHQTLLFSPHVEAVGRILKECIADAT